MPVTQYSTLKHTKTEGEVKPECPQATVSFHSHASGADVSLVHAKDTPAHLIGLKPCKEPHHIFGGLGLKY